MTVGSNTLNFAYDASGTPLSVVYNGTYYYYVTNLQGDVVAILNSSGTSVVTYTYDAWGRLLTTSGTMASTLGAHNPLRYRGYVYDTEFGLYYLQSRYYNPEMGRFLSSDTVFDRDTGLQGYDLFAYCGNNPVNRIDISGADSVDFEDDGEEIDEEVPKGGLTSGGAGPQGTGDWGYTSLPNRSSSSPPDGSCTNSNSTNTNTPGTADNPLTNIVYTDKVMQQMDQGDFHGFPSIVDNYGYLGRPSQIIGGDGHPYIRLSIEGYYKDHYGEFVYIWDMKGVCNHRCFEKR